MHWSASHLAPMLPEWPASLLLDCPLEREAYELMSAIGPYPCCSSRFAKYNIRFIVVTAFALISCSVKSRFFHRPFGRVRFVDN
jgi:hypothetical protein